MQGRKDYTVVFPDHRCDWKCTKEELNAWFHIHESLDYAVYEGSTLVGPFDSKGNFVGEL